MILFLKEMIKERMIKIVKGEIKPLLTNLKFGMNLKK